MTKLQKVGRIIRKIGAVGMVLSGAMLMLSAFASRNHDEVSHSVWVPLVFYGMIVFGFGLFAYFVRIAK